MGPVSTGERHEPTRALSQLYSERVKRPAEIPKFVRTDSRPLRVIRLPELRKRLSIARSTVYDWMNPHSPRYDKTFPVPIKLSATRGAIAWMEDEVDAWLTSRSRTR